MNTVIRMTIVFRYVVGLIVLITALLATSLPAVAVAQPDDEITVKDTTLKGRILGLEKKGIRFKTIYGEGTIVILYEDVQKIEAHGEYHIIHGDQQEVEGRLLSVDDGQLLIGDDPATAEQVAPATIQKGVSTSEYEEQSWIERLRNKYPYWEANLDLGLNIEEGAVIKHKIEWGFNIQRRKNRHASWPTGIRRMKPNRQAPLPPLVPPRTNLAGSCWASTICRNTGSSLPYLPFHAISRVGSPCSRIRAAVSGTGLSKRTARYCSLGLVVRTSTRISKTSLTIPFPADWSVSKADTSSRAALKWVAGCSIILEFRNPAKTGCTGRSCI